MMKLNMDDDPPYSISVTLQGDVEFEPEGLLTRAVEYTLQRHKVDRASVNVAVVDDAAIAQLNKRHLTRNGPTDVLTFDLRDSFTHHGGNAEGQVVDGEIVVSVETARRQAQARRHDLGAEMALYVVHGVLHLLGFNDGDESSATQMHLEEDAILVELGVGRTYHGKLE